MRPIREAHSAASSSFHLIFYDFDSGGPGWRASDPYGVFQYGETNGLWDAFLNGYTEVRPFGGADLEAVPYFVAANMIWNLGADVTRLAARSGLWRLDEGYFDQGLALLRRWDAEQRTTKE